MGRSKLAALVIAVALGRYDAALAATGGPDSFGYTWRDTASGATYSWQDAMPGTAIPLTDDQNTGYITLPFTFTYYGTPYTQVAACSNGWASFTNNTNTSYTNLSIPDATAPNALMAPFWDDLYDATFYHRTFGTAPNRWFVMQWHQFPDCCSGTNPHNTFQIVLFEGSNVVRFQYLALNGDLASCSVGVESAAGTVGLECLQDNVPVNGFALGNAYAVEFLPPTPLACAGATVLACDASLTGQAMGAANNASVYSCAAGSYAGLERIFRIDLASTQNLDVTISNFGADALDVFLLSSCAPGACLAGGADSASADSLPAGTYYVVVDGATAADNGPFDLQVDCNGTSPGCGQVNLLSETFSGGIPGSWTVTDGGTCTGAARTWTAANPGARVPLAPMASPFVIVDSDNAGTCDMDETLQSPVVDCTVGGPFSEIHVAFDHYFLQYTLGSAEQGDVMVRSPATGGTWQVLATYTVTSPNPESADFDISGYALGQTSVEVAFRYWNANYEYYWMVDNVRLYGLQADCSGAIPISCPYSGSGTTVGGTTVRNGYSCSADAFLGREVVYELTTPATMTIDVALSGLGGRDMEAMLLSACSSCFCVDHGTSFSTTVPAGTYYVVVDGYTPADDGPFDLDIGCADPCASIPIISCNVPVSGDTSTDPSVMAPSCGAGAGPEEMWKLFYTGPVGSNLVVSMPSPSWDHVLYALNDCTDPSSCVAWTDAGNLNLTTTSSPQTYYIVVDGYSAGASGTYSNLLVTCPLPNALVCTGAPAIACNSGVTPGTTVGKPAVADQYAGVNGTFTGSESIYVLTLPSVKNVDIYLDNHPGRRQYLFLLSACNVNNTLEGGVGEIHRASMAAGTYYIVVDGRTPADDGTYDIRVVCNDPGPPPSCTPPCNPIFTESFTGGIPASWTVVDGGNCAGPAQTWTAANPGARVPVAPMASPFVIVDSDFADVCDMDERLESPTINATTGGPYGQIRLRFDHYFRYYTSGNAERGDVLVRSTATGGVWQVVQSYTAETVNPEAADIDISAQALGQTNVQVAFRYWNANYEWYWMVDNVQVCGVPPGVGLDCLGATPVSCGSTVPGNTAGAGLTNDVLSYTCGIDLYAGDEQVFVFTVAAPTMVQVALSNFGVRELDAFILDSCSECDCVAGGEDVVNAALQPGTYYIVVDGFTAADNGPFDLTLTCTPCTDPGFHNRWSSCENPRAPITLATTSALEWNFDDCDYCRQPPNACFTTPCTFDMYIVAECGTIMHMPLYDNETGRIRIWDFNTGQYVYLFAQSTGGWSAQGTEIIWQDCSGIDPRWNDETTDIYFTGAGGAPLCGIYRAEFVDWGGFIWDLFSNCTGTDTPGFKIYDSYCEALANYDPYPALSVESMSITGACPTYTVNYGISNAGCRPASTTVVATSDLGGSASTTETNILPGETRLGSVVINVQSGGAGSITAYADFYDDVLECVEAGGSATACSVSGGNSSLTQPVQCACLIPQFSNVQVVDLACPVGIRLTWAAATFPSGTGHYDIYRSTISFADAVTRPPLAALLVATTYDDNATTPGTTYYYVVRGEDSAPTSAPCVPGPHSGAYTDVNAGPIRDNLSQTQNKPYDIANDLRNDKLAPTSVRCAWPTVTPHPNTTHWHVYRSADPSLTFPDNWTMICPEKPLPGWLPPGTIQWDDTAAAGTALFYDVRSANDCEDISPGNLRAIIQANTPSCSGSGVIDFSAQVLGGVPPYGYLWNFGDLTPTSTLPAPSHAYAYPPYSRTATLTVTDSTVPTAQMATTQRVVTFGPPITASFGWSSNGLTVTFLGSATGGTGVATYAWDFGDNQTSTQQNPVHTYAAQGTYTVQLVVTDQQSLCQDSETQDVTP